MSAPSVWILNHYAVTPDLPGGTRHIDLGRELAKRGWHVTIFASSFQHHDRREAKLAPGEMRKLRTGGRRAVRLGSHDALRGEQPASRPQHDEFHAAGVVDRPAASRDVGRHRDPQGRRRIFCSPAGRGRRVAPGTTPIGRAS